MSIRAIGKVIATTLVLTAAAYIINRTLLQRGNQETSSNSKLISNAIALCADTKEIQTLMDNR